MTVAELVAGHPQEWHDQRRRGLGSSDVAAALGLSPHGRPIDVHEEKLGLREPREDNAFLEWGRRLEPVIAEAARDATGIEWRQWPPAIHCKRWDVAFTHLDRRGRDHDGAMAALECKAGMGTKGWGEPGTASVADAHGLIPAHYAIQCAHHLLCTGYQRVYVAALIGYRDFRMYVLERDEAFLDDLLADEQAWWQAHVVDAIPPDPDGSEAYRAYLRRSWLGDAADAELSATPEQMAIAGRALEAKRLRDAYEQAYELERQRLERSMGSTQRLLGAGWTATRTAGRTTTRWAEVLKDARKAGIDLGELLPLIEAHTKTGDPSLTLKEED